MTVKDIIMAKLKEIGADGLCNRDMSCGCEIEDIPPCECPLMECEPANRKIATIEDITEESEFEVGDEIYVALFDADTPAQEK